MILSDVFRFASSRHLWFPCLSHTENALAARNGHSKWPIPVILPVWARTDWGVTPTMTVLLLQRSNKATVLEHRMWWKFQALVYLRGLAPSQSCPQDCMGRGKVGAQPSIPTQNTWQPRVIPTRLQPSSDLARRPRRRGTRLLINRGRFQQAGRAAGNIMNSLCSRVTANVSDKEKHPTIKAAKLLHFPPAAFTAPHFLISSSPLNPTRTHTISL